MQRTGIFHKLDAPDIAQWLSDRGLNPDGADTLPEHGVIVRGVAAGFIRRCEGGYALFDSYISNPKKSPQVRDKALDAITKSLILLAKDLGISKIIAYSVDNHTLLRAKRLGFKGAPHEVITLDLTKES